MKKAIAIVVSILFVFSLTGFAFAVDKAATPAPAETKAETGKATEAKPAPAAKVKQITGEVKAVDTKANTLTIKGKRAEVTVTCADKTKVMMGKEKKSLADVKVGDKVVVKYTESEGKNVAKSIAIKPAEETPKAEKKEESAEKPMKK